MRVKPRFEFVDHLTKKEYSAWIGAGGDMINALVQTFTARTTILNSWIPLGEVTVNTAHTRNVFSEPVAEGRGKVLENIRKDIPVNKIKVFLIDKFHSTFRVVTEHFLGDSSRGVVGDEGAKRSCELIVAGEDTYMFEGK